MPETTQNIASGTYEIIRNRLHQHKDDLQKRLNSLNAERQKVFGSLETKLIANDRINTDNSCIASDIISLDNLCIFGYNVHFGLRTKIQLNDVFSIYEFSENQFHPKSLELINDSTFIIDFTNLYKYYRNTFFTRFAIIGNYLHMVFQLSENVSDIKTFKWLINDQTLTYVDNRSEHEYKFPAQHEFRWQSVGREMHRYGTFPHASILDKVFVETIGGDLTIKIEDNTEDGEGIYSEPVEYADQTLDDGQIRYADLGNLIVFEVKPFQEKSRYFVYNHKLREVNKIDSLGDACILLPDEQGIIFPTGYYLQTGEYYLFDNVIPEIKFAQKILSPNGEDVLFVFYLPKEGLYNLMSYNVISQEILTPIICSGFTIIKDGELCYFKSEEEQTRHHLIQIWQTPYLKGEFVPTEHKDNFLYKVGNKDIVKAMAETHALITLLSKEDNYAGLYADITKSAKNIADAYYWISDDNAFALSAPLKEIQNAAKAAIDEFEKVVQFKKNAEAQIKEIQTKSKALFSKIKGSSFKNIDDFVQSLSGLRNLRGEVITLKEVRYIDTDILAEIEQEIVEETERLSQKSVHFLLEDKALDPYHERVKEKEKYLDDIKKAIDAKNLEKEVVQIATDLEMLIEIVSNLKIEDTSQSTKIIDNISLIFAHINQLKAAIKNKINNLGGDEAKADFAAQMKLVEQSLINLIDLADTPAKCDEFQSKITVQLEELESKFADYDAFIVQIMEKREEIYDAFDARKNNLIERQNQRISTLKTSAERILKNVEKKADTLKSNEEIHGYFASDLMVSKVRDIIAQLEELDDRGGAEDILTSLKTAKEDSLRKLRDKQDLYEDGENIIKLGDHKFGVNRQALELTMLYKDEKPYFHLAGTDYYQSFDNETLAASKYWTQEYSSENKQVYRAEYLAYKIFKTKSMASLEKATHEDMAEWIQKESSENYTEGYTKGVHDQDALAILEVLIQKHLDLKLLRYNAKIRAAAQFFWYQKTEEERFEKNRKIKSAGEIIQLFPGSDAFDFVLNRLINEISIFAQESNLFSADLAQDMAQYLMQELQHDDAFQISQASKNIQNEVEKYLKEKNSDIAFYNAIENTQSYVEKIELVRQYVKAFIQSKPKEFNPNYIDEVVANILFSDLSYEPINAISAQEEIKDLKGTHEVIQNGTYHFDYQEFIQKLGYFHDIEVPAFEQFRKEKAKLIEVEKEKLKLHTFQPNVLSSFVRNKLIDEVYLPLFGDNFAKQLGTADAHQRIDRMGLLLLISPPGYGKTTLMEYLANRLGLVFMKINGPTIGHEVTSVDPMAAKNSAAREELIKLNLAFEMGNNVMLYLDDIQHCNPEFLQKFISLSDGTRSIEGVYNGRSKTYNLRGKKFAVVMAGNPYTESGAKFQVPDMLTNRADIYNLGDIIGNTKKLFEMSLIENAITSNADIRQMRNTSMKDVYQLIDKVENNSEIELEGKYSPQEINDYTSVLEKMLKVRDVVLKVNSAYIKSAAMEDEYRTEPAFKLQGSYRDMNKLVSKIVPVMNDQELESLLLSHYESEAQTLTSSAEANLLKYKELTNKLTKEENQRWNEIKTIFEKNNKLKGFGNKNEMAQVLSQLMNFGENLEGIKEILAKGLDSK